MENTNNHLTSGFYDRVSLMLGHHKPVDQLKKDRRFEIKATRISLLIIAGMVAAGLGLELFKAAFL